MPWPAPKGHGMTRGDAPGLGVAMGDILGLGGAVGWMPRGLASPQGTRSDHRGRPGVWLLPKGGGPVLRVPEEGAQQGPVRPAQGPEPPVPLSPCC